MYENEVIEAIKLVRKYKSETSTIEVKSAANGFQKNVMTLFLAFQIKMVGLLYSE